MQQPGTIAMNRKQKPASAYQYYKKLVQDFDMLEREMESHQEEQSELEAQLERAKAKIHTSKVENHQAQQLEWERERDRQMETFAQQHTAVETLRAQTEALDEQELRLQAEIEVLHEKIQEASETEPRRIRRLVHERTTLLEDELTKGKLDLDYIAQVISTGRKQELKQQKAHKTALSSVQNLVQDVQERRRRDFEMAEANFQTRMQTFQLEKDVLSKKAKELRVTKQRALQILSQNQQIAIKDFFDTPPTAQQHEGTTNTPSLHFKDILQSINQSGSYVEQLQEIESERKSGRRDIVDALQDARMILERGTERIEAIQKRLSDRKAEAQKLGIVVPGTTPTGYDGAWGIDSYSPRQYETVYFIRGLVFSWMDTAVAEVSAQPTKELLESEINRWRATHANVEHDLDRDRHLLVAGQILVELMNDVTTEIARDIRSEFEWSAFRVRNVVSNALKSALFPNEKLEYPQTKKVPAKTQISTAVTTCTRSSLFQSSLDHLRVLRNRGDDSKSMALLHQCCLPVSQQQTAVMVFPPAASKSPTKKLFGFFSTQRHNQAQKKTPLQSQSFILVASKLNEAEVIPFHFSDVPSSSPSATKLALTFWQNDPQFRLQTIILSSSQGYCSCLQLSPNGDLLICGTTEGELVVWDLLTDQPTILRVWSPPKAERSQITRVIFSPDAQSIIAFFRRKTVGVFTMNPNPIRTNTTGQPMEAMHSGDCFPTDPTKYKPRHLQLLMQISATDALAELSFTSELRERAPNAVAKDPAASWSAAELSCGSFFASFSLTGMMTCNTTCSMLCGASTGDLLKVNLNPGGVRLQGIQAAFDSPGPEDIKALNTKSIRREFFRSHLRTVLFASCIHREHNESKFTEILSVDQGGIVCMWEYSTAKFTGFGWFEPTLRVRLELTCSNFDLVSSSLVAPISSTPKRLSSRRLPLPPDKLASEMVRGEIVQVALTPDDTRLVCMVFHVDPRKKGVAGTLRFLQIDTSHLRLNRVQLNVDFVGGNGAPRFAVTTNFLLLLANNFVRVYILRTGNEARKPIPLSSSGPQLVFNNISCSTSPKQIKLGSPTKTRKRRVDPTTITFVVSGDQHSRLLVHSFTASNPQSPEKK